MAERIAIEFTGDSHSAHAAAGAVSNDVAQMKAKVGEADKALGAFNETGGKSPGILKGIGSGLSQIGLAAQGLQSLVSAAKGLGDALGVGLAVETENVRARFTGLTGSGTATTAMLKQVRTEADKTQFQFGEMADAAQSLLPATRQAGVGMMDLIKIAETLAASNPLEGLKGASFALKEAISGDFTSIIERFNISRSSIQRLKDEGTPALGIVTKALAELGITQELVAQQAQTATGKFSTFSDGIAGLRLQVGTPILERLKVELEAASKWLDANKTRVEAFARTFGTTLASAISTTVGLLQASAPTLAAVGSGLVTMIQAFQALPGPIKLATVAMIALGVAATAIAANPVVLGLAAIALGAAYLTGRLREATDQTADFSTKITSLQDLTAGAAAAATQTYTRALESMRASGKGATEQVSFLEREGERLYARLGELTVQGDMSSKEFLNLRGSFDAVRAMLEQFGITVDYSTGRMVVYTGSINKMSESTIVASREAVGPFGAVLDEIARKAKNTAEAYELATKYLGELTGAATSTEQVLGRQVHVLDAIDKNAAAAFSSRQTNAAFAFAGAAKEFATQAGLSNEKTAEMHRLIGLMGSSSLPVATKAQADLKKLLADTKGPLEDQNAAYAAGRKVMEDAATAQLGLGRSMTELKEAVQTFVDTFLLSMGKVPPRLAAIVKETKEGFKLDVSTEAGQAAESYIRGLTSKRVEIYNAAFSTAIQAKFGMNAALEIQSPSRVFFRGGQASGEGLVEGAESMQARVYDAFEKLAEEGPRALVAGVSVLAGMLARLSDDALRPLEAESRRLQIAIARLNLELLDAEPFSEHAAAIQGDINILTAWNSKVQGNITILGLQKAELDAARTALDGWNKAWMESGQNATLTAAVGTGGAPVARAAQTAVSANTPEAGAALFASIEGWRDRLKAAGVEGGDTLFNELMNAGLDVINQRTPEAMQAFLNKLGEGEAAVRAKGEFSGATFGEAFAKATAGADLLDRVGGQAKSLFDKLSEATEKGGAQNIQDLANLRAQFEHQVLDLLPPSLRDDLRRRWDESWARVIATGGKEGVEELRQVAAQAYTAGQGLPRNLAKLEPEVRAAIDSLNAAFLAGTIGPEQYGAAVESILEQAAKRTEEIKKRVDEAKQAMDEARRWFEQHGTNAAYPGPGGTSAGGTGSGAKVPPGTFDPGLQGDPGADKVTGFMNFLPAGSAAYANQYLAGGQKSTDAALAKQTQAIEDAAAQERDQLDEVIDALLALGQALNPTNIGEAMSRRRELAGGRRR